MSDEETLEELREMYQYAKRDAAESQEQLDSITNAHYHKLFTLYKAQERYLAHLEMMAAGVKQ